MKQLIDNIGCLVSLSSPTRQSRLEFIRDGWIYIEQGKVQGFGPAKERPVLSQVSTFDAKQQLVMPGLVDAHTHLLYAGDRSHEFALRIEGATYQEIGKQGGGIRYSMKHTRETSDQVLLDLAHKRLRAALRQGITTLEIKSGYGLSVQEELRHLRLLNRLKTPQSLSFTCLALHAASPEHNSLEAYIEDVCQNLLPQVPTLCGFVDAFVEEGYYSAEQVRPYFEKAKSLGLRVRVHADEFSNSGGAKVAAEIKAMSADHLQWSSDSDLRAMAAQGVVAVILPGTSLYTKIPFANARKMADLGCNVAIATDFNPGSCQISNLAMLASIASVHCGLTLSEAISGVTTVPAHSLGLGHVKGAIKKGYDADLLFYELDSPEEWLARMGEALPTEVMITGLRQLTQS